MGRDDDDGFSHFVAFDSNTFAQKIWRKRKAAADGLAFRRVYTEVTAPSPKDLAVETPEMPINCATAAMVWRMSKVSEEGPPAFGFSLLMAKTEQAQQVINKHRLRDLAKYFTTHLNLSFTFIIVIFMRKSERLLASTILLALAQ